jgi:hypothetical protein
MKTAGLIFLSFLAPLVTDVRAQEASFPLNVEGASAQLQRTPRWLFTRLLYLEH